MVTGARRAAALLAVALLGGAGTASGQGVTARIEPRLVPLGGTAELTIEVDPGSTVGSVDEPALPELPSEIAIVARARESRVSVTGLDVQRRTVFRYTLRGIEAGTARIDPIAVRIGGETRFTEPLVVLVVGEGERRVVEGGGGPTPPIFVSARVDRPRAWVGQQVTLTFSFYHDPTAPLAESPDYDPPETPGFWRVELSAEPEISSERIGDRLYQVQRFRYALFPLQSGAAEIGAARVRVIQPDVERWWEPGRARIIETDPLTVMVDELPAGSPQGFGGAVGRYALSGGLALRRTPAGSPVELAVTVGGTGNPATVGAPEIPEWPGIDVGSPSVETETEEVGTRLGGRSTFRWILVPGTEGKMDLGSIRLPYFDPDLGTYAVDTLRLGELAVLPGPTVAGASGETRRDPTLWEARAPREPWPRGLAGAPLFWAALAGPWLAWLGLAAWRRRPERKEREVGSAAAEIVNGARREIESRGPAAASAAARAVDRALEIRAGVAVAGLPPRERRDRLARHGVPPAVVEAAEEVRATLEDLRFGGGTAVAVTGALDRLARALSVDGSVPGGGGVPPVLPLAVLLLALAAPASGQETVRPVDPAVAAWRAANEAYRTGDFGAAARGYAALAGRRSDPRIEANLAAALWRQGRRGEALARYHDALALAPREGAIRDDARRLWLELERPPQASALARGLGLFRLDELLLALLAASLLGLGTVALARRRVSLRPAAGALLGVAAGIGLAALLHAWTIERPDRAVATAGAEILASPGGEPIASLPEGALVRVLEREPDGWRVDPPGQPAGWVAPDRIVPLD
ncbi:MAG TPA: BatD family protein [Gemmatimonadota bacterium]|nr:BatD family protein [Gemmatimonadota bacterium]